MTSKIPEGSALILLAQMVSHRYVDTHIAKIGNGRVITAGSRIYFPKKEAPTLRFEAEVLSTP